MAREILYNALIKKYEAEIADANAKVTIMLTDPRIIPEHIDITGEIDKELGEEIVTGKPLHRRQQSLPRIS